MMDKTSEKPLKDWTLGEIREQCKVWDAYPDHCVTCRFTDICRRPAMLWEFNTPKLAQLLNLRVRERFYIGNVKEYKYFIDGFGDLRCVDNPEQYADCSVLCAIIQDPSCITRC